MGGSTGSQDRGAMSSSAPRTPRSLAEAIRLNLLSEHADKFADITLVAQDGTRIPAVRALLGVRSGYFRKQFFSSAPADPDEVAIDASGVALRETVQFAYTDDCRLLRRARHVAGKALCQLALSSAVRRRASFHLSSVDEAAVAKPISLEPTELTTLVEIIAMAHQLEMKMFAVVATNALAELLKAVPRATCLVLEAVSRRPKLKVLAPSVWSTLWDTLRRAPVDSLLVEDFRRAQRRAKDPRILELPVLRKGVVDAGVLMLSADSLEEVLKDDDLFATETYLFQVLYYWATCGTAVSVLWDKPVPRSFHATGSDESNKKIIAQVQTEAGNIDKSEGRTVSKKNGSGADGATGVRVNLSKTMPDDENVDKTVEDGKTEVPCDTKDAENSRNDGFLKRFPQTGAEGRAKRRDLHKYANEGKEVGIEAGKEHLRKKDSSLQDKTEILESSMKAAKGGTENESEHLKGYSEAKQGDVKKLSTSGKRLADKKSSTKSVRDEKKRGSLREGKEAQLSEGDKNGVSDTGKKRLLTRSPGVSEEEKPRERKKRRRGSASSTSDGFLNKKLHREQLGKEARWEKAKQLVHHINLERLKPSFLMQYVEKTGLLSREKLLHIYKQQALESERGRALYDSFRGGSTWENGSKVLEEKDDDVWHTRALTSPWIRNGRHEWTFRIEGLGKFVWIGVTATDPDEFEFFANSGTGWGYSSQGFCMQGGALYKKTGPAIADEKTVKMILNLTKNGTVTMVVEGAQKSFRAFADIKEAAPKFLPVVYHKKPSRITLVSEKHVME